MNATNNTTNHATAHITLTRFGLRATTYNAFSMIGKDAYGFKDDMAKIVKKVKDFAKSDETTKITITAKYSTIFKTTFYHIIVETVNTWQDLKYDFMNVNVIYERTL